MTSSPPQPEILARPSGQDGKAPRTSEERFRALVSSVKDYAIFMLDPSGRIESWNAGAERTKGYTADEIIGEHMSRFYTPEDLARGLPAMLLDQAQRDGRVEIEGWRVRKDGTRFWADVVITALFDEQGRLTGYAKVTRDLT
ncbi:MAG TPA: PAS domain S-box protein, partial [Myxococcaceae bacterium]|nr:PAS domain S-box protein [Myxococcaceae bacterium]